MATFPVSDAASPAVVKVTDTGTTISSASLTVPTGYSVVVGITSDSDNNTGSTPTIGHTGTATVNAWTREASSGHGGAGDVGLVALFSATVTAGGTMTVTVTHGISAASAKPKMLVVRAYAPTQVDAADPIGAIVVGAFPAATSSVIATVVPQTTNGGIRAMWLDWNATGTPTNFQPSAAVTELVDAFHNAGLSTNVQIGTEVATTAGQPQALGATLLAPATDGNFIAYELRGIAPGTGPAFDTDAFDPGAFYTADTSVVTGSVALTGSGGLTTAGTPATSRTVALTGSGSLAAPGTPSTAGAAALSGSGSLAAPGAPSTAGAAALTGAGALTTTGAPATLSTTTLTGSGTLATAGQVVVVANAALTGTGSLTAAGTPSTTGAAALTGIGALSATSTPAAAGTVTLGGTGALATSGQQPATSGTATLTGTGALATTGRAAQAAAATLTGSGTLTSAGSAPATSGTAALTGSGSLTASTGTAGAGTAALTGTGQLAATAQPTSSATVALTGSGTLTAAVRPTVTRTVALTGAGTLTTTGSTPTAGGTAALTGVGQLAAAGSPRLTGLAVLTGTGTLELAAQAAARAVVDLAGDGQLVCSGAPTNSVPYTLAVGPPRPPGRTADPRRPARLHAGQPTTATTPRASSPLAARYQAGAPR